MNSMIDELIARGYVGFAFVLSDNGDWLAFATDEPANRSDALEIIGSGMTSYGETAEEALRNILR